MSTSSRFAVAVHILILLISAEGSVPSSLVAGSVGTSPTPVRRLVAQLVDAGFVTPQMDATGGTTLVRPADRITLLDVFRVVEAPVLIALPPNTSNLAREISREITGVSECTTERAQAALEAELAAQTIASILSEVGHVQCHRRWVQPSRMSTSFFTSIRNCVNYI